MRKLLAIGALAFTAGMTMPAEAAQPSAAVRVSHMGTLSDDGATVTFTLRARCAPGLEILEALATVSQDNFVEVFFGVPCDDRWHRVELSGSVFEGDPVFVKGRAQASALLLLEDPATGGTVDAQHSVRMRLND